MAITYDLEANVFWVVIEETIGEIVVVSVYKTSQIDRYPRGLVP